MKKIFIVFAFFLTLFVGNLKVNAATSITITPSTSRVVVGNKVTYTVRITSTKSLIAIQYGMSYDSKRLTLLSGSVKGVDPYTSPKTSATYTFVFRARASGTANFSFNAEGASYSTNEVVKFGSKSRAITIITQKELEATYSKNNNLSLLGVTGYKLTPAFNQNTLSYKLEVENDVREVTITGTRADTRSTVRGLGKKTLEEGINKFSVVVTAQNGISKTYVININVKELEPIEVVLNDEKYNVVRKEKLLIKPNDLFVSSTIKINDLEVPAFFNEASNITLVGLTNADGVIELYQYNEGKYTLYEELSFPEILTIIKELDKIPEGFTKSTIKIGEKDYVSYTKDNTNYLNLLNLKTGKSSLYRYDKEESTVQKYIEEEIEDEEKNDHLYVIIILSGLLFFTYLAIVINYIKKTSAKNKKKTEKDDKIKEKKKK